MTACNHRSSVLLLLALACALGSFAHDVDELYEEQSLLHTAPFDKAINFGDAVPEFELMSAAEASQAKSKRAVFSAKPGPVPPALTTNKRGNATPKAPQKAVEVEVSYRRRRRYSARRRRASYRRRRASYRRRRYSARRRRASYRRRRASYRRRRASYRRRRASYRRRRASYRRRRASYRRRRYSARRRRASYRRRRSAARRRRASYRRRRHVARRRRPATSRRRRMTPAQRAAAAAAAAARAVAHFHKMEKMPHAPVWSRKIARLVRKGFRAKMIKKGFMVTQAPDKKHVEEEDITSTRVLNPVSKESLKGANDIIAPRYAKVPPAPKRDQVGILTTSILGTNSTGE